MPFGLPSRRVRRNAAGNSRSLPHSSVIPGEEKGLGLNNAIVVKRVRIPFFRSYLFFADCVYRPGNPIKCPLPRTVPVQNGCHSQVRSGLRRGIEHQAESIALCRCVMSATALTRSTEFHPRRFRPAKERVGCTFNRDTVRECGQPWTSVEFFPNEAFQLALLRRRVALGILLFVITNSQMIGRYERGAGLPNTTAGKHSTASFDS